MARKSSRKVVRELWGRVKKKGGTLSEKQLLTVIGYFFFYRSLSEKQTAGENKGYSLRAGYLYNDLLCLAQCNLLIESDFIAFVREIEKAPVIDLEEDLKELFSLDLLEEEIYENLEIISTVLIEVEDLINNSIFTDSGALGETFEALMGSDVEELQKEGVFYSPKGIADVLTGLANIYCKEGRTVYDPTCGAGSLLVSAFEGSTEKRVYYGQELSPFTSKLARISLFLTGCSLYDIHIKSGNTLEAPEFKEEKFDIILSNPPYGISWDKEACDLQERFFEPYPEKKCSEFAFIEHCLYMLSDDGVALLLLPLGSSTCLKNREFIRKRLVVDFNCVEAVVQLPPNLFNNTPIAVDVWVLKKNRSTTDVLMVDGTELKRVIDGKSTMVAKDVLDLLDLVKKGSNVKGKVKLCSQDDLEFTGYKLDPPRYAGYDGLEFSGINQVEVLEGISKRVNLLNNELLNLSSDLKEFMLGLVSEGKPTMVPLGDLVTVQRGSQVFTNQLDDSFDYPVYSGGKEVTGYYSNYNCDGEYIIVACTGSSGALNYCNGRFWLSSATALSSKGVVPLKYIYNFLKLYEDYLGKLATGTGIPKLYPSLFINLEIPVYSEATVRKITSLVERIEEVKLELEELRQEEVSKLDSLFNDFIAMATSKQ